MSVINGSNATPEMKVWALRTFPNENGTRDMVRSVFTDGERLTAEIYTGEIERSEALTQLVTIANRFDQWPKCFREGTMPCL